MLPDRLGFVACGAAERAASPPEQIRYIKSFGITYVDKSMAFGGMVVQGAEFGSICAVWRQGL